MSSIGFIFCAFRQAESTTGKPYTYRQDWQHSSFISCAQRKRITVSEWMWSTVLHRGSLVSKTYMKKNLRKKRTSNFIHRVSCVSVPLKKKHPRVPCDTRSERELPAFFQEKHLTITRASLEAPQRKSLRWLSQGIAVSTSSVHKATKIASVEAIKRYSPANTPEGRWRCYYGFLTGSVHAV